MKRIDHSVLACTEGLTAGLPANPHGKHSIKRAICFLTLFICLAHTHAQTVASVPYTPSWMARHYLQWLSDHAGLRITGSHWPLPAAAVEQALSSLNLENVDAQPAKQARDFVNQEIESLRTHGRSRLHVRNSVEALNGYSESDTPSSSLQLTSPESRLDAGAASLAWRLGARVEASSNGIPPIRPDGSALVLGFQGWQLQAFSHQHWWGPGWQSSLVNGHNNPAWQGAGIQRSSVAESDSAWLSWMGPWNLDLFVAKAQDPSVVANQPSGFVFSGMRLTMKPKPWLELGASRGLQTGGAGRPSGVRNFATAFLGQQVNQEATDTFTDSSGQIAGFDARISCSNTWTETFDSCALYTQWMGEDAAGRIPLPYKFMTLWGIESTFAQGQYRAFAEWSDSNANSLPWDTAQTFPGYVNGVYKQGYTQGGRWVGPAQGSGSQVLTLGWLDASTQRLLKLHTGRIHTSLGTYDPRINAPHGRMWGVTASQVFAWQGMALTPEVAYTKLAEGDSQAHNKRNALRLGASIAVPF